MNRTKSSTCCAATCIIAGSAMRWFRLQDSPLDITSTANCHAFECAADHRSRHCINRHGASCSQRRPERQIEWIIQRLFTNATR
jgi:hypothetical protein